MNNSRQSSFNRPLPCQRGSLHPDFDVSLLSRSWRPACVLSWTLFVTYEVALGFDKLYRENPICPYSDRDYAKWYWFSNFAVLGGFCFTWVFLLLKIALLKSGSSRIPHLTSFNIVSMGIIATILAIYNWGGVCIDRLGVASPAAIWGEWIACGPLLIFITVTVVDKPALTKMDWFLMITFFLCLIFGWCIIVVQDYNWGVILLVLSCLTYAPLLYLPFYLSRPLNSYELEDEEQPIISTSTLTSTKDSLITSTLTHLYTKRSNLALCLTIILPIYTINYLLAWGKYISIPTTIIIYQFLSILAKAFIAALTMEAHVHAFLDAEREVERRANVARRAFLKYIFHEVRTPLNSLTMGIEILQMSENLNEEDMESLVMMKGASEFMSDILNDVLSMQKIEEGKLELDLSPFSIKDAINKVFLSLRGASSSKHITLQMEIGDGVPDKVIGDRYRIEQVISSFVNNAIKFTPNYKTVRVVVTCGSFICINNESYVYLTIWVIDEGEGISMENQTKLFNNLNNKTQFVQSGGQGSSGLGLFLCKEIVTLHGGTIGIQSVEGQGSTFSATIPFVVLGSVLLVDEEKDTIDGDNDNGDNVRQLTSRDDADADADDSWVVPFNEQDGESEGDKETRYSASDKTSCYNKIKKTTTSSKSNKSIKSAKFQMDEIALVVDDVESNRKMLMMLLRKNGIEARTAKSGQEALDLIRMNMDGYKLVFMDNLMPVMNGVDATRILRQEGYRNIIVGVTGNVLEDDLKEYLAAGADFVIGKPLKMHQLDKVLRHVRDISGI